MNQPPPDPRPHDWRLLSGALAVWLAALLGLLVHWSLAVVVGSLAALAGAAHTRCRGRRARDGPARLAAGVPLFVCGVLAVWPVAARIHEAAADPLRVEAARGAAARLQVEVVERPRPVRAAGFGGLPSGVHSVVVPAVALPSGARILILAPVDRWAALLPGQQAVAEGTLAPAEGGTLTVAVLRVRGSPASVGDAPAWQRAAHALRAGLRQASEVLDPESAGLLPALVVGDKDGMSTTVEDEFRVAGMSHLLAVSGANLAIVCVAVLYLLRLARIGPRGSAAGALCALVGYVLLAGPEPSVLRAGVMGAVGLLALALGRERSALPALGAAMIVLVVHDPAMAVAFGFVLSVLATGALVLLAPKWTRRLTRRGVPRIVAEALAVPAAAHLVTAPVVAGMSGQVSLVAVAANLAAAPVVAPATVLGVLAALVMPVLPWLAEWLARLAGPEVGWLVTVGRTAAGMPGAALDWPAGWWGGAALLLTAVAVAVAMRRRTARLVAGLGLTAVLLVVIPVRVIAPGWPPSGWAAVACDVGQGDAVALSTADPGRAVLVDTGPESAPTRECLNRLGVDRIPLVILSHLHADHVGGLSAVLSGHAVGAVAVGPGRAPEWAWRQVREEAADAGVPLVQLTAGQRMSWPGLAVEVLAPRTKEAEPAEADGTQINNRSVVLRATTRAGRLLLTGDIELAAQADLLTAGVDLSADVVKVPHHGSRYTAPEFLAAIGARVAMVSVGAGNRYGHPSPRTLGSLAQKGVLIVRTDTGGDCAVVEDGGKPAAMVRGEPRSPPGR
ncbi:DNA internalization-related competence protein ComEC/Rec2 [Actinokineospora iranica]|uniref:Competence protein ComEC n=1 Tax=Actinokineospora iranica TaxID=1271860 RepID=A0A1G6VJ03_9PSEU|nr:DNA internalization-related competence protein ComEC/Rec2 [Actinokineospora iranica]SDD53017.1 competence protein ComEC [Actinokineospora iranica]